MYTTKITKSKKYKLPFIVLLGILTMGVITVGTFKLYSYFADEESTDVKFAPATQEEKDATEQYKKELLEKGSGDQDKTQLQSNADGKLVVSPTITSVSQSEIRSFIQGIAEEEGTCSATAEKEGKLSSGKGTGFVNVSYTQCSPISWDSQLSPGTWKVTLNYSSPTAEGSTSQSMEVR